MRIFVNNVDGYLAGAICADLRKLSSNIIGTRRGLADDVMPPVVKKVVPRAEVRRLLKTIAACDVAVYDLHDADFEELELILQVLYKSELAQELVLVLISSVGVWARTQREYEQPEAPAPEAPAADVLAEGGEVAAIPEGGEPEAAEEAIPKPPPPPRPVALTSEDYTRRMPAPRFQEWRNIETLALALKDKGFVRPYVVCAGVPYGNGEEPLLGLFKAAWQVQPTLRVIGTGDNYIPTVHVRDAARLVRHVVEERPPLDYHLAVDRGDATQRVLVEAVAAEFGVQYEIRSVNPAEAILAELADILTMDLRLEPSKLMLVQEAPAEEAAGSPPGTAEAAASPSPDGRPASPVEELDMAAIDVPDRGPAPFRWWCETGLPGNVTRVASEFKAWRRLDPVRLCVAGPPGSGTAELGARLAEQYQLPHFIYEELLEEKRKQADTPLGRSLREKFAEVEAAFTNPKSQGPFLVPASLTAKVIDEAWAASKSAGIRGFVISGFPQSVEEAVELFLEEAPKPQGEAGEAGGMVPTATVTSAKEKKPGGKKDAKDEAPVVEKVPRANMRPDGVIIVACPEDACLARMQASGVPEDQWLQHHKRRTERWLKESPDAAVGVGEFFRAKLGVEPLVANEIPAPPPPPPAEGAEEPEGPGRLAQGFAAAALLLRKDLEARREINNFLPPPQPEEPEPVEEADNEEEASGAADTSSQLEGEEMRRRREQEERLEQIRKEEIVKLEKHSEPLRQYLMGLVVPPLTTGLVEVCREQPEDPVAYLAEYLATYVQLSRKRLRP